MEKMVLSVQEFGEVVGIGSAFARALVAGGAVKSFKLGARRLVAVEDARAFIDGKRAEAERSAP